jgi:23S rRNA-/tRNA-specific pseudouridylate synthase
MREGAIKKLYRAVVRGVTPDEGEISLPLYKDSQKNFVRPASPSDDGYDALTRFRRLETNKKYSLLEVELVTGRPHQARVHLSSIGYPIVGDVKYGDSQRKKMYDRLMLHAWSLSFPDFSELPLGTRGLTAISTIPEIFRLLTSSQKSMQ